ncbi:MAG: GNAT family N-acetyltransferase [Spirochaetes bacterium]|nr:GNAT family N-acetyltransferase [Spirochaetota bacterium]
MKIKEYKDKYLKECINTFIRVYNAPPWNNQWTFDAALVHLTNMVNTPGFIGYVSLENSKVVAACIGHIKCWWDSKEYFIDDFFVDDSKQRSGYGSELLEYIQKDMPGRDIKSITIVIGKNSPADNFYDKNKFDTLESLVFKMKKI